MNAKNTEYVIKFECNQWLDKLRTLILSNWEKKRKKKNRHEKRRCVQKKRILMDNRAISDGCTVCTGESNTKQDFGFLKFLIEIIYKAFNGSKNVLDGFDVHKTACIFVACCFQVWISFIAKHCDNWNWSTKTEIR